MNCKICGNIIDSESIFCQKCGKRIENDKLPLEVLEEYLSERLRNGICVSRTTDNTMLLDMHDSRFKKIEEKHQSAIELLGIEDILGLENGISQITNISDEDFIKLCVAVGIDEFEAFGDRIDSLGKEFHNDRIAHLHTAMELYNRAVRTCDDMDKRDGLSKAAEECILALNMLKEEIGEKIVYFENFPKSNIKKMSYLFKINEVKLSLKQVQDAFHAYCYGVNLLLVIDAGAGEKERVLYTIDREVKFLGTMVNSRGYKRLLEIDDENVDAWDEYVGKLSKTMYFISNKMEEKKTSLIIEEERDEQRD